MNLTVQTTGVEETLRAVQGLERDLRKEANSEIRRAAKESAGMLVVALKAAAASSGVPVAPRVARSIKVVSDRFPTVSIGGSKRVGVRGAPASALVHGSERGGLHFGVSESAGGYWITPTVRRFEESVAVPQFKRALFEITRRYGLDA